MDPFTYLSTQNGSPIPSVQCKYRDRSDQCTCLITIQGVSLHHDPITQEKYTTAKLKDFNRLFHLWAGGDGGLIFHCLPLMSDNRSNIVTLLKIA